MIAVLSDVHGNLEALEAVARDALERGVDRIFFLGDLIGYGPNPLEVVQFAMKFDFCLSGNHEKAVLDGIPAFFHPRAAKALKWTRKKLFPKENSAKETPEQRFLRSLPTHCDVDGFFFCHDAPQCPGACHYISTEKEALEAFKKAEFQTCFIGHTHCPGIWYEDGSLVEPIEDKAYSFRGRQIIDVGSIGQPRDNDPRACYVIIGEKITFHRVEYDYEVTMKKIVSEGLDDNLALRLEGGE